MSATRHVPPAPPATRLAVGAALAVLVAACGAMFADAAAGLAESGDALVALGLAALGGAAGAAVVVVACRRGMDVASAAAGRLRRRRRLGRVRGAARAVVASLAACCPTPRAVPTGLYACAGTAHPVCCAPARVPIAAHVPPAVVAAACAARRGWP